MYKNLPEMIYVTIDYQRSEGVRNVQYGVTFSFHYVTSLFHVFYEDRKMVSGEMILQCAGVNDGSGYKKRGGTCNFRRRWMKKLVVVIGR